VFSSVSFVVIFFTTKDTKGSQRTQSWHYKGRALYHAGIASFYHYIRTATGRSQWVSRNPKIASS